MPDGAIELVEKRDLRGEKELIDFQRRSRAVLKTPRKDEPSKSAARDSRISGEGQPARCDEDPRLSGPQVPQRLC